MSTEIAIQIDDLTTGYGEKTVHEHLNLSVYRGEVLALVGGSGCGKTTLLRAILNLIKPMAGSIQVFGESFSHQPLENELSILKRWGVLFQTGALFSGLTVLDNTCFPLRELTDLPESLIQEIAMLKISMAEFPLDSVYKYPSELSGGMLKRAALARAIVMDPKILFLDEPTAGLDPNAASKLDDLINRLQKSLHLTILVVTHDLDTLWRVADRVAFLGDKRVLAVDSMQALLRHSAPLIVEYFSNSRADAYRELA
jgi:phospholipid/cholesterol/gamma-HCH transport system ATP-binding protein